MIIIENAFGGLINLFFNAPPGIREKITKYSGQEYIEAGKIEVIVLFGENRDIVKQDVEKIGARFEDLNYGFGIITINADEIEKLNSVRGILYAELPKTLFTSDLPANRASCIPQLWSGMGLSGEGVLVGFIDTGIDYTHPAFKDEAGNTRIDYIYDLSANGVVYTKQDINNALASDDSLQIVPEQDFAGHGTHVAGIACGGGNIPESRKGVAFNSSIAMVKTTRYGNLNYALSTQLMRGIKFLVDKATQDVKPLVINISMSTNDGAHNGTSLLEQYIQVVSTLERVTIIVATGNEGDAGHHSGGKVKKEERVEFSIAAGEPALVLQLYKPLIPDMTIEIINPLGASSGIINLLEGYRQFRVGLSDVYVYNTGPKPFDINGEVIITLFPPGTDTFSGGLWAIIFRTDSDYEDEYNLWMPTSEGLDPGTKFLQPNVYNTIGIPATVTGVIAVGSYNYLNNTISTFSGVGNNSTTQFNIKPTVVAPGENIISATPGGGYDSKTGTSMAAPFVSGSAALLMQWGIVQGNDPFLYGQRLKFYLAKGARRNRTDIVYPDPRWGYGELCASSALDDLKFNLPRSIISNTGMARQESRYFSEDYQSILVEFTTAIDEVLKKYPDVELYKLTPKYGILTAPRGEAVKLVEDEDDIVTYELGAVYTLTDISPLDAANVEVVKLNPYLNLTGRGVLVGLIDTGIDYLNEEFINEDNTSRIVALWDQTINDPSRQPKGSPVVYGSEYSREDINKAIEAKNKGEDPYSIVASKDTSGHGTAMASLVGAKGKNPLLTGVAPDCEFIIVKLKEIKKFMIEEFALYGGTEGRYETSDIMFAVRFLTYTASILKKPIVLYSPLGTNYGPHDGNGIVERSLEITAQNTGVIPVASVGNQGDSDTHTSGVIQNTGDSQTIEVKVGRLQRNLIFNIWIDKPNKVSVTVISPSGENTPNVKAGFHESVSHKFIYEGTNMTITIDAPEEATGDERIEIKAFGIREGIWQVRLTGDYIVDCKYDAWLPQLSLLAPDTKFLNSDQFITLTSPSTAHSIISAAYYNQNNNFIVPSSGRGYTRDGRIKPDLAAGGINADVAAVGGGVVKQSGASVAGAIVTGCCALMLQWGIVDKNDKNMYMTKLKTYLIRGTTKRKGDTYPNRETGYGFINMEEVFNSLRCLRGVHGSIYKEYTIGNLFIRIPE